jgi:hypothetical protein
MMLVKAGKAYIKEATSLQRIHASISEHWHGLAGNVCFGSQGGLYKPILKLRLSDNKKDFN